MNKLLVRVMLICITTATSVFADSFDADQRDLKFILTDFRQAGLLAHIEDGPSTSLRAGRQPTFHVVRHPDHAARFEQFYWDVMAGQVPSEQPRAASIAPATGEPRVARSN